jgi:hypothetical protein
MKEREKKHWESGSVSDPHASATHQAHWTSVEELTHIQTCLYATLDGWTKLARAENITWAAVGGTLFGAMCNHAMLLWDDDMDIAVPQAQCTILDEIWNRSTGATHVRPNVIWVPRQLKHFGLTVWRGTAGDLATHGHTKFSVWDPTRPRPPQHSIDVMCTGHIGTLKLAAGKRMHPARQSMVNKFTSALTHGQVASVEFGPTTILQVRMDAARAYARSTKFDLSCGEMPPLPLDANSNETFW